MQRNNFQKYRMHPTLQPANLIILKSLFRYGSCTDILTTRKIHKYQIKVTRIKKYFDIIIEFPKIYLSLPYNFRKQTYYFINATRYKFAKFFYVHY